MRLAIGSTAAMLALAWLGHAQPTRDLDLIEPGVEDIGPLGVSMRTDFVDLRSPSAFENVYRAADGEGYMRISGAMVARFFRSQYARSRNGASPIVADGTVYFIGARDGALSTSPDEGRDSPLRIDGRAKLRIDGAVTGLASLRDAQREQLSAAPGPERSATRPTVWSDEPYRRARLGRAIAEAVLGESPASNPSR